MAIELTYLTPLLEVFDMARSLRFYCDVLGFAIVEKAGPETDIGWVWLQRAELNLMLNTAYELPHRPVQEDPLRVKAHKDTTLYFGCPDVDGMYRVLRTARAQYRSTQDGVIWNEAALPERPGWL